MHWIIQDGMYREEGVSDLLETLERFGISHDIVTVSGDTLTPDVSPTGLVMICGTYRLMKIGRARGWKPGSFHNDMHDHRAWTGAYGTALLNHDAVTCRVEDVERRWNSFFLRPSEDSKTFSGTVMSWDDFVPWRIQALAGVNPSVRITGDTLVVQAPVRTIYREARFFVVDGEPVAWSTYRVGKTTVALEDVDPDAASFARQMIATWVPARAFVLDVALTEDGWRVVEVNCINCSGFYGANVPRIVMAIEDMQGL